MGSERKLRRLRREGARAGGGHGGGKWTVEGMVPGWVGWSQQQLLMDCMQKGAEAEDLEPEPVWEAGKRGGGKQGGCGTPDSEEWAWESVFIMSRPPR